MWDDDCSKIVRQPKIGLIPYFPAISTEIIPYRVWFFFMKYRSKGKDSLEDCFLLSACD